MTAQYIAPFDVTTHDTDMHGLYFGSSWSKLLVHGFDFSVSSLNAVVRLDLSRVGSIINTTLIQSASTMRIDGNPHWSAYDFSANVSSGFGTHYVSGSKWLSIRFPEPLEFKLDAENIETFAFVAKRVDSATDINVSFNAYTSRY